MDDEGKHGVLADIQLHVSDAAQGNTQPGESDTKQHIMYSTVSTHSEVPTDFPTYSIDHYNTLQDIKRENELPTEDDTCGRQRHSIHDGLAIGLESVKLEEQEQRINECDTILPFNKTDQEIVWNEDSKELIETKQENADCAGDGGNSEVTRRWVVCAGGVLKEIVAERGLRSPKLHQGIGKGVACFTCDTCGKSFVRSCQLKVHEITHTGVKPFKCSTCGKSFRQRSRLNRHERAHTGVKPNTCLKCGKSYRCSSSLVVHERMHSGEKPFTCSTCGSSFAKLSDLKGHKSSPFSCGAYRRKLYERRHYGENLFLCSTCGKSFIKFVDLKAHCCTCGKSFTTKSLLKLHEITHIRATRCTCATCGKSFIQSGDLKEHERAHSAANPYASACSGKSFAESGGIEVSERTHVSGLHVRATTHNGVKLFTCSKCEKSFTCSKTLNVHEQSHSIICATCGKTFGNSELLTFHEMTHTDIKLFACTKCGKSFEESSRLKVHIRTHCDTDGSTIHDIKR